MSVQSEIDRIITAVGNAYSKVSEKGGTVPSSQTVANLATAIDSIPAGGGGAPSLQSKSVTYTSNGTNTITPDGGYDGLSSVDVTVNVVGGYQLKIVTHTSSKNELITDVTITHNCNCIPKFIIIDSNNNNKTYLYVACLINQNQSTNVIIKATSGDYRATLTNTTLSFNPGPNIRYASGRKYTYYFFY